jgi:hypothetical protein
MRFPSSLECHPLALGRGWPHYLPVRRHPPMVGVADPLPALSELAGMANLPRRHRNCFREPSPAPTGPSGSVPSLILTAAIRDLAGRKGGGSCLPLQINYKLGVRRNRLHPFFRSSAKLRIGLMMQGDGVSVGIAQRRGMLPNLGVNPLGGQIFGVRQVARL